MMRAIVSYEVETDLSADEVAELVEHHMCELPSGSILLRMTGNGVQVSVELEES